MPLPSPPLIGTPIPHDCHAVSVQFPTWQDMVDLGCQHPRIKSIQKGGYPRSFIHQCIQELAAKCGGSHGLPGHVHFFYPTYRYMEATKAYILSQAFREKRTHHPSTRNIPTQVLCFSGEANDLASEGLVLYTLLIPSPLFQHAMSAWRLMGFGISSRLAMQCLQHVPKLLSSNHEFSEISKLDISGAIPSEPKCSFQKVHAKLRGRLADLQNLGRINTEGPAVTEDMIFLYPTGMTAIFEAHQLVVGLRHAKTVVFGFLYELTPKLLRLYGSDLEFFGNGTREELDEFEEMLKLQRYRDPSNQVQAVWCECASNPLLKTVDLERLRRLADQYGFFLIVDDTIGSVANIDVLEVADIIVTSLTKSFSGYANVMAGSVILNPASRFYVELRQELRQSYQNSLFIHDAVQLELNSRDYLARTNKINQTASYLVQFLQDYIGKPTPLSAVYYPETCCSAINYRRRMRARVSNLPHLPGFGGVFTLEFINISTATAFFDALNVHKGPSLGAQYTLAQPYVQTVFQKEKSWAASYGLKETVVRISVGLEDKEELKVCINIALDAAMYVFEETQRM